MPLPAEVGSVRGFAGGWCPQHGAAQSVPPARGFAGDLSGEEQTEPCMAVLPLLQAALSPHKLRPGELCCWHGQEMGVKAFPQSSPVSQFLLPAWLWGLAGTVCCQAAPLEQFPLLPFLTAALSLREALGC